MQVRLLIHAKNEKASFFFAHGNLAGLRENKRKKTSFRWGSEKKDAIFLRNKAEMKVVA